MGEWTDSEIEILKKCVNDNLSILNTFLALPKHNYFEIREKSDKLGLYSNSILHDRLTVEDIKEYISIINTKKKAGHIVCVDYFELLCHNDNTYSIAQYKDDIIYAWVGRNISLVGCYKILQDIEDIV